MNQRFYESDVVRNEMEEMQNLYQELYEISMRFPKMKKEDKREHIEKTMELIAKQKVFYARISLLALEDPEAREIKTRLDEMTKIYSQGKDINNVLTDMELKLNQWKQQLDNV